MYTYLGKLRKKNRKSIYQKLLYKGRQFLIPMIRLDRKRWIPNLIELLFIFKADRYRKKKPATFAFRAWNRRSRDQFTGIILFIIVSLLIFKCGRGRLSYHYCGIVKQ